MLIEHVSECTQEYAKLNTLNEHTQKRVLSMWPRACSFCVLSWADIDEHVN